MHWQCTTIDPQYDYCIFSWWGLHVSYHPMRLDVEMVYWIRQLLLSNHKAKHITFQTNLQFKRVKFKQVIKSRVPCFKVKHIVAQLTMSALAVNNKWSKLMRVLTSSYHSCWLTQTQFSWKEVVGIVVHGIHLSKEKSKRPLTPSPRRVNETIINFTMSHCIIVRISWSKYTVYLLKQFYHWHLSKPNRNSLMDLM